MIEIIPSINVRTFEEVQERIRKVEPYVQWCHLDITDGIFSKHITWNNPVDLSLLVTTLKVEVHFMVQEPEKTIDQWLVKPIKRIIVHIEAAKNIDFIIEKCRSVGVAVGLAANPETPWEKLEPWFGKIDMVQTLAVHPGPSAQKFDEGVYKKIMHIRTACPHCIIEVDGGVNNNTTKKILDTGANVLVAGAAIFGAADIRAVISELKTTASV